MNLEAQRLGFKKAYNNLENSDKVTLLSQLLESEQSVINNSDIVNYISANNIYNKNVLLSVSSWEDKEVKDMLFAKREKDLENIKRNISNNTSINDLISQISNDAFTHFYSTFS